MKKIEELHCHYCGSALVHYRQENKYICDKCFEKLNNWGEKYFSSSIVPGGFIQLNKNAKHTWRDFGKKSRLTKKEKVQKMVAEAELIL